MSDAFTDMARAQRAYDEAPPLLKAWIAVAEVAYHRAQIARAEEERGWWLEEARAISQTAITIKRGAISVEPDGRTLRFTPDPDAPSHYKPVIR